MLGKSTLDNQISSMLNGKSCAFFFLLLYLIRVADMTWEQKGGRTMVVSHAGVFEDLCAAEI